MGTAASGVRTLSWTPAPGKTRAERVFFPRTWAAKKGIVQTDE